VEDRIGRELRRHQLALRMIAHRARRQTICNFAGLTREKIKTLRREWHVKSSARRRGPSPTLLSAFFRSARTRSEASVIALFCRIHGAVPREKIVDAARYFPSLDRGERLCDVYEAYRTYFPESEVTFELIVLLAIGMAEPNSLDLRRCSSCPGIVVIDLLSVRNRGCSQCARTEQRNRKEAIGAAKTRLPGEKSHKPVIGEQQKRTAQGNAEHAPERKVRRTQKLEEKGSEHAQKGDGGQNDLDDGQKSDEEC
jgi:hypothetical protein